MDRLSPSLVPTCWSRGAQTDRKILHRSVLFAASWIGNVERLSVRMETVEFFVDELKLDVDALNEEPKLVLISDLRSLMM